MRILVKGAGVAGLVAAHALSAHGADVTVHERGPRAGSGASWFAGGMLAPYCERESADARVLEAGLGAISWWETALPGLVSRAGTLVVAPPRDGGELARFAARTSGSTWVDEDGIADLEPDLAGRFRQGLFFGAEAHLDPRRALGRLEASLRAGGTTFSFGPETAPDESGFDHVVDCSGAAAIEAVADLRPVRGEMLYLASDDVRLSRPVRLLHPRHPIYLVPRDDGLFMLGATMIESGAEGPITARSLMELLNSAYAVHPAFGEAAVVETGTGLRPAFADNYPRVWRDGRHIRVNGMYRHGFLLAPAMAQAVVDEVGLG